jgi:hypothetical protein
LPDRPSVNHFALIRYRGNGDPDPAFGQGGSVRTGFRQDRYFSGTAVAIQEDGKIVVADRQARARELAYKRHTVDSPWDKALARGGEPLT